MLWAPFAVVMFQIVTGVTVFKSAIAIEGPVLIALSLFALVITLAAVGDFRVVLRRGISGTSRIARHLWRMCFCLTLALGSAFTNGFARLLPGPYHVPWAFFLPQLLMLGVLLYWVGRVRFPGWAGRAASAPSLP